MSRFWRPMAIALLGLAVLQGPAFAHENHQQEQVEERESAAAKAPARVRAATAEQTEAREAAVRARLPWHERLLDWLGRLHPSAVHFPIALIPASLLALVLARRRGEGAELVRILVVVAGLSALAAASLGWLDGGFALADRNPIKLWHRWIGTGLGTAGAVLALLAWRRRVSILGNSMALLLAVMTIVLFVQGWLGGAMVHGIRHMNW